MEITERIRLLRERKGLREKDVAERIGVSRPFYSLLETGKRPLTVKRLEKIASVLGVTVAELYGEKSLFDQLSMERRNKAKKEYRHIQLINPLTLHSQLEPLLGDETDDAIDCFMLWAQAPRKLKQALRAYHEEKDESSF